MTFTSDDLTDITQDMVVRYRNDQPGLVQQSLCQIFRGRAIHSKSLKHLEILRCTNIGVDQNGTITFVDTSASSDSELRLRYAANGFSNAPVTVLQASQFLFPGLIDTHLHAPQWPNLALGMEGTLREWVENYTDPMEASYSDNEKAQRVYADVVKTTLRLGTTTVAYNTTIHADATNILADCVLEAGQRAIVGKMCILQGSTSGNWEDSAEGSLKRSQKCIDYVRSIDPQGRLVRPCVQPRGGPYCSSELMRGLGEQSESSGAFVQAHMCETQSDIDRTLELHPDFRTYSDMYRAYGLLNSRSILAHCIHLQPQDIANIVATGAGVAHNPNSNTCLRDGECRVRSLLDAGIKVGLGTDCSAGYMPSIHDAMKSASNVSRHLALKTGQDRNVLSFNEILYLATMGGAEVVGLKDKVGNFEVGKQFDALVIDVQDVLSVDASLWEDDNIEGAEAMVKKWVFCGDDRTIKKVYVDGRLVSGTKVTAS